MLRAGCGPSRGRVISSQAGSLLKSIPMVDLSTPPFDRRKKCLLEILKHSVSSLGWLVTLESLGALWNLLVAGFR